MKINIVIPVRNGSRRVPNKNFRPFIENKSLLEIKIEQLLKTFDSKFITVNGDKGPAENISEKYGVNFIERASSLTSSSAMPADVWKNVASNYSSNDHMAYVLCNNPFFEEYEKAIDLYKEIVEGGKFSGLASTTIVKKHIIDIHGKPQGFEFGKNYIPSEKLKFLYEINGGIQISRVSEILKTNSLFGISPKFHDFGCQSFEIDSIFEFKNSINQIQSKLKNEK